MSQPLAQLPGNATNGVTSCALSQVVFANLTAPTGSTSPPLLMGGFKPGSAPGGLFVQAPGLTLPMLWNRGSMYNLGQFADFRPFPGLLPPLGAQNFDVGNGGTQGALGFWWDSPQAWGQAGYLIRRPRTLIVNTSNYADLATIQAWVITNLAAFQALNVSIYVQDNRQQGKYAPGIPFNAVSLTETDLSYGSVPVVYTIYWATPTTDATKYVGGDCFIAVLMNYIFPEDISDERSSPQCYLVQSGRSNEAWNAATGFTLYQSFYNDPIEGPQYLANYLQTTRIAAEITALVAGAAKFNSFQAVQYQYNQNPTVNNEGFLPNPTIPNSVADSLIAGSSGYLIRKTFAVNNLTAVLAQLLIDATAFFTPAPP